MSTLSETGPFMTTYESEIKILASTYGVPFVSKLKKLQDTANSPLFTEYVIVIY